MNFRRLVLWFWGLLVMLCVGTQGRLDASGDPAFSMRVMTLGLKENEVTYVPTNPAVTLFLQFPTPISDFTGRGFSEDPSQVPGDFFVRHVDGDSYLTIAPLTDVAQRTLHIVCSGHGYPIHFFPAAVDNAWDKIIFTPQESVPGGAGKKSRLNKDTVSDRTKPDSDDDPFSVRRSFKEEKSHRIPTDKISPAQLIGMIDMMRLLANLQEKKAAAIIATNPALSLSVKERDQNYGEYTLKTHFVMRNDYLDAIGFAVTITNETRRNLEFGRDSFTVRAGDHVYHAVAADFDPHVRARARAIAFFVMSGNGLGGPNNLSVDNNFSISLDLLGKTEARPTITLDVPPAPAGGSNARGQ